ncbi:adenylyltransferase/cytidyltransferase family protein [Patescibacteria group bacterium]
MDSSQEKITTFDEINKKRSKLGRIIAISGGFDPIHPGHISYIQESKKHGDTLIVIVNGDAFLTAKKGKSFQDLETRSIIVSAIAGVDYVVPFEIKDDQTVCRALELLRPHIFANGGDRKDVESIPEWEICKKHNIKIMTGVGVNKQWSSSKFLRNWGRYYNKK